MPIYKQWQHSDTAETAIWSIEESEDFFLEKTRLQSDKKNAKRRIEHLAGRFLLQYLLPDFPLDKIELSALGKPFLPGENLFFSLSHSFPFIGVTIDREKQTGIDVQTLQEKIIRLQHKFLSDKEQEICANDPGRITLAWAAKEAAFKKYGLGAVDFIRHMPITEMNVHQGAAEMMLLFSKEAPATPIYLHGGLEKDFAWSVTL